MFTQLPQVTVIRDSLAELVVRVLLRAVSRCKWLQGQCQSGKCTYIVVFTVLGKVNSLANLGLYPVDVVLLDLDVLESTRQSKGYG